MDYILLAAVGDHAFLLYLDYGQVWVLQKTVDNLVVTPKLFTCLSLSVNLFLGVLYESVFAEKLQPFGMHSAYSSRCTRDSLGAIEDTYPGLAFYE